MSQLETCRIIHMISCFLSQAMKLTILTIIL